MSVVTKVEPIDDWIEVTVNQHLSLSERQAAVADFAKERLQEAQAQNRRVLGRIPPHEQFVDGRKGAPLGSVNPNRGVIVIEFELIADVLLWIGETLRQRSPVKSGRYRSAHTLFADGVEVPIGGQVPAAEEYMFINPLPYSRKIEIGTTEGGRDFVVQVPNRIYERTAMDARRRFGNMAKIKYGFQATKGTVLMAYGGAKSRHWRKQGGGWGGNVEWKNRVPTITVRVS